MLPLLGHFSSGVVVVVDAVLRGQSKYCNSPAPRNKIQKTKRIAAVMVHRACIVCPPTEDNLFFCALKHDQTVDCDFFLPEMPFNDAIIQQFDAIIS